MRVILPAGILKCMIGTKTSHQIMTVVEFCTNAGMNASAANFWYLNQQQSQCVRSELGRPVQYHAQQSAHDSPPCSLVAIHLCSEPQEKSRMAHHAV